jgi:hypothetical protein
LEMLLWKMWLDGVRPPSNPILCSHIVRLEDF